MDNRLVYRDSAGFRARSLQDWEYSDLAERLVARLSPSGGHDLVVRLATALSIASDGLFGDRVFWLIEDPTRVAIALAHSSPEISSVPHFDGLVWLWPEEATRPAPFDIAAVAMCSIAGFCARFLGYPVSPGAQTA